MAKNILNTNLANATREVCEILYEKYGSEHVYDYANKILLNYDQCKICDANTPTISDKDLCTCALCGLEKK